MRKFNIRWLVLTTLLLSSILCSGCAAGNKKSAAENLNLVLAGMDGSDGVTFEGSSSLLLGGKPAPEAAVYFGGTVADHNKVSLYTLLPDGDTPKTAVRSEGNKLKSSSEGAPAYYTKLEKKDGEWALLSEAGTAGGDSPLPALNPLRQLEELQSLEKKVTEEAGAARGTRVLRIELSNAEANRQLATELTRQMEAIRPEASASGLKAADKGLESLQLLWVQKNKELQEKLKQASVETVYYLKADTKRNLPKRLSCTRKVSYSGVQGAAAAEEEIYLTEVNFYGYK
ncbi:hypothetical protein [Paenibacillus sp. S150]|uniref:hypothetical protein n=1 Tax=Paenibacillus sp. S150 TaxID=2749826 RepID=UPI001C597DBD|nr:hypothetical protein [Paenibacillus sp. S150]MBW4083940.1 hypothetical protein [Paenibacillus sp. S150]